MTAIKSEKLCQGEYLVTVTHGNSSKEFYVSKGEKGWHLFHIVNNVENYLNTFDRKKDAMDAAKNIPTY